MSRWALIPVKGFERGKSRLADVLGADERAELTRNLFDHVVEVLRTAPSIDHIAVVSDSPDARAHAESLGIVALADSRDSRGLADVVDSAQRELALRGATSLLICMSDLPELSVEDIERISRALDTSDVVLVPDLMQEGTNLIAMKPATTLPSCLGHDDSLSRHRDAALERGLSLSVQVCAGIGFDVDHPGDLERLRNR